MLDRLEQVGTWTCTLVASTHLDICPYIGAQHRSRASARNTSHDFITIPLSQPYTLAASASTQILSASSHWASREDAKGRPHVGEGTAEAITNFPRLGPTACSLEEGAPLRRKHVKQPDATVPWTSQLLQHTYKAENYEWPRDGPCDPPHVRKHAHT